MDITLKNGARVVKYCRLAKGANMSGAIAMCEWRGEYATWTVDQDGNAYWGTYGDYETANDMFNQKCRTYGA